MLMTNLGRLKPNHTIQRSLPRLWTSFLRRVSSRCCTHLFRRVLLRRLQVSWMVLIRHWRETRIKKCSRATILLRALDLRKAHYPLVTCKGLPRRSLTSAPSKCGERTFRCQTFKSHARGEESVTWMRFDSWPKVGTARGPSQSTTIRSLLTVWTATARHSSRGRSVLSRFQPSRSTLISAHRIVGTLTICSSSCMTKNEDS